MDACPVDCIYEVEDELYRQPDELRARLQVAGRILELQTRLADRVRRLERALEQVTKLDRYHRIIKPQLGAWA